MGDARGPDEGCRRDIAAIDVGEGRGQEFGHVGNSEATEWRSVKSGEEALDEVEPRYGGQGEVELDAQMAGEPLLNRRVLVALVVVEDDQATRDATLDATDEAQGLLMPARSGRIVPLAT